MPTDVLALCLAKNEESDWFNGPGYEDLLEATGLTVVESKRCGSYQGDAIALVRDETGREGIAVWGYGSCSGCDTLEAIMPNAYDPAGAKAADWSAVNSYADEMRAGVEWAAEGGTFADVAARKLAEHSDWYTFEDDMKAYLVAVRDGKKPA